MSLLRRIVHNSTKAVPVAKAFRPYPLGRDPSSLLKLDPVSITDFDSRPLSLRYRVTAMIEMCNLDKASKLSRLAVLDELRVESDTVFICNSVMGVMCSARSQTLPNMLSCNIIMKSHCDQRCVDHAIELYRHILLEGRLVPGMETYMILTKGLVDAKRFDEACDLVESMSMRWSSSSFMVYDILIRGFLDIGNLVKARQILEEWKRLDSKHVRREYDEAITIFDVSFMNFYFKQGKDEETGKTEAWELFGELIEVCDSETVNIMSEYFSEKTVPLERLRKTCYRTMIACLCENGKVSEAETLFAEMFTDVDGEDLMVGPDLATFRAMINGYVQVGRVDDAIKTLNKLRISNIRKLAIHRDP
ncbi:hypothetical protein CARUB_v10003704mg [Capsella rubella]|uniref:Pentacotripeptide-repeat region of PRORP domain-containing protein n=1 Tax=Capsella rubella TaxID=81985 RepID=R0H184_9BRAS|nr:hypothetical protein CARUB_v10003704mg [Capsella rubella]